MFTLLFFFVYFNNRTRCYNKKNINNVNILHSPLVITKIRQETLNQELFTLLFFLFISTTRPGVTLRKRKIMWTVYIPLWWLQNYHKNHLIKNSKSVHLIKECQGVHITFLFVYSTTRAGVTIRKKKNNVNSVHSPLVITKIRQKALDQER